MNLLDLLVAAVILVGLVGIVLPVLPGSLLIFAAVVVWAFQEASTPGWVVLAVVALVLLLGAVVKYVLPGRGLRRSGVPRSSLLAGAVAGVVGFFVVPVVGLVIGFVLGVYVAEVRRLGASRAWPSTVAAVRAVGLAVLVELAAGLLSAGVWAVGAVTL